MECCSARPATTTFLGLEACHDLASLSAPVALLGVPGCTPYKSVGPYSREAPDALRKATASLVGNVDRHDFDFGGPLFPAGFGRPVDCGNIEYDAENFALNRDRLHARVSQILQRGCVPVLIGGDDSVPIPMLSALSDNASGQRPLTVFQIDAHIDWRNEHAGERLGLSSTMRRASELRNVERIIQVGARGIGSASSDDYADACKWGVQFVTADDLDDLGAPHAASLVPEGGDVVLCIDADAFDPSIMPGVIGRVPGGLTFRQGVALITGVARRARIVGADFVEYMPGRDVDGLGALTLSRLIMITLGLLVRQGNAKRA